MKRKQLLLTNNKKTRQKGISVSITYNRYLTSISKIITKKNWNILQISPTLQRVFDKKQIKTYKRNENLGELIEGKTVQGGKVFKIYL